MYLRDWIEIDVNNLVQIACHNLHERQGLLHCTTWSTVRAYLGHLKEGLEIKLSTGGDESVEGYGG